MPNGVSLALLAALVAVLAPSPSTLAQTSTADVREKVADAAESIKSYTADRKDEAVAKAKKVAADLDARIKELESRASTATGAARTKADRVLADLREQRAKASQKLTDLGSASAGAWDNAKQGFADAYRDLAHAYERAAAQFRK